MSKKHTYDKYSSNSFGGGDMLIEVFNKRGIIEYIDAWLGDRSPRAEYTYGEGIITWLISKCRGAKRVEDIYDAQYDLLQHPKFGKGMSPDTFLYMLKELECETIRQKKTNISEKLAERIKKGKAFDYHEINVNDNFNELLIDIAIKLGLLEKGKKYILDYDTTEVKTKIKGARKFFNGGGKTAYCPGVAMINNIPIYIENRNGDSNAKFNLTATVEKVLSILKRKGIEIEIIRIDSAAFSAEFTNFVNSVGLKYVTRAMYTTVKNVKKFITNWEETTIKNYTNDVGDTFFHWGEEETRMVVKKVITGDKIKHWGLITNIFDQSNEEIIKLYAQRGDAENMFSSLYKFGWEILPMRTFAHNTVFLYVTALNYTLFRFVTKLFAPKCPRVSENMKLRTFIRKFMFVTSYWVRNKLVIEGRKGKEYSGLFAFT